MLTSVCVFCGSSSGNNPLYAESARRMGRLLAERGVPLIYGGSNRGLMGVMADACLSRGGRVTGVIPQFLVDAEIAHRGLSELLIVRSMHERKAAMADRANAFIAMPGGFGTWEEFCEVVTWSQLGFQQKPCALLNVAGYYDPLLSMADRAVSEGFVRQVHRKLFLADSDPERLLDRLDRTPEPLEPKLPR